MECAAVISQCGWRLQGRSGRAQGKQHESPCSSLLPRSACCSESGDKMQSIHMRMRRHHIAPACASTTISIK
jgi:hypothetical protein